MNLEIESRYLDYINATADSISRYENKRVAVIKLVSFRNKIKESFEHVGKKIVTESNTNSVIGTIETSIYNDISDLIIIGQKQAFKIVDKYIDKLLKQD